LTSNSDPFQFSVPFWVPFWVSGPCSGVGVGRVEKSTIAALRKLTENQQSRQLKMEEKAEQAEKAAAC